jgi:hypothetical protein
MPFVTIAGYPIDVVETEEHSLTSEITDHPVEEGSDVADNIRRKPRELTLTGAVVSNTPIGAIAQARSLVTAFGASTKPAEEAYQFLEQLFESRDAVTIVTDLKKYDSMALETLTIPREAKNAGGLIFTAHFKEVRIISNQRVTVALPNLGGERNLGLSIDKLVAGKKILWRKGRPPGSSTATVPPGTIYAQEIVTIKDNGKKPSTYLHASGKPLSKEELEAFDKDFDRDTQLMTNRGLYRAEQELARQGTVLERANNLADYKQAHPGENPDPSVFGLSRSPDGHWTAK